MNATEHYEATKTGIKNPTMSDDGKNWNVVTG